MKCGQCQHENRPGAKFCEECAAPLARVCPHCGGPLSATAKFCSECAYPADRRAASTSASQRVVAPDIYTPKHLAEKILTSKAALQGERKQVTVLFADLKGSMELLADRDPEEARTILDPVLELMMEAVHRYEGTVNQVMGDGIMALFGAPLAHEDHAVRACYAALRMQESVRRYAEEARRAHGVTVRIRVGLNSGHVVVRAIGSDLHMDYTAVGQTTHLAARMEQLADPGSILLSADTLRLAEGYVQVNSMGLVPVKGLPDPVEIFELSAAGSARTRLQAAALRGFTRFVGRDAEVEHLRRVLGQADAGRGQVVALVGEAGVGKSRLTYEFTHSHRVQGWLILESSSVSYGKATSYLPVIELLKGYFKIGDRDDHREMRAKVLGRVLDLDRALELVVPPLLALLDVPVEDPAWEMLDPEQRRQRTLDAVRRLLLRESQVQPLLAVFEDLHWIDGETQALLDRLVESLGSARMLLLVNYRPEYEHRWASKTAYSQLRLDSLPADSAAELLAALLGPDPGVVPLAQMLVKRGNPFFLEETVRTLVETGALAGERGAYRLMRPLEALQVPATVQTMLAARIDRLPAEEKQLLQAASVIGRSVPYALLAAITSLSEEDLRRGLGHLQAAEFLRETQLFPDPELTFKHALTHEVTYRGLLQERRRALHARVVQAIETLHRDRLGEQIERLAHHAVRGELREQAVSYLRQAGLKATARSAPSDARGWFEQALEVLATLPETPSTLEQAFDIRLELRQTLTQLADVRRALERLREAETLAERLNDDRRRGRVYAFIANIHTLLGELDEALVTGTRALEIAERLADVRLRIPATTYLEQGHYLRGEHERVVALATANLAVLPAEWVSEFSGLAAPPSVYDRCWLILSLAELGRFGEAAQPEGEAIRLAAQTQHAFAVGWAHISAGQVHLLRGDWAKARPLIEHATTVLRAGNVALTFPRAVVFSAWALAELGEASEALNRLREGEQLLERQAMTGYVGHLGWRYLPLGRAALALGRLDDARRLGDRALESSSRQPGFAAHALHLLGDIATHPDRFDAERGRADYRQALALAEPRGMRPLVAHCRLGLGRLDQRAEQREQAHEHLIAATTMYREMGMTSWLKQAEAEMGTLP
jgi:class 3 adenylate cyclase/tetratricopeptide (TPR) repeat protein